MSRTSGRYTTVSMSYITLSMVKDMTKIDLNSLPGWSQLSDRLLGRAPWVIPFRTIEKRSMIKTSMPDA